MEYKPLTSLESGSRRQMDQAQLELSSSAERPRYQNRLLQFIQTSLFFYFYITVIFAKKDTTHKCAHESMYLDMVFRKDGLIFMDFGVSSF
jgi:hypothetical protein